MGGNVLLSLSVLCLPVQYEQSSQPVPPCLPCHDGRWPRIVSQNKTFLPQLLLLGHLSHQQETRSRKGDALISKGRKLRGYYSRRQLNIWLPEFKTMLMEKSLFLSHIAKQGAYESHGSRCSCFSATWRSSWCRHGALTVHYPGAAS